jgi:chromosome segregation ATPase
MTDKPEGTNPEGGWKEDLSPRLEESKEGKPLPDGEFSDPAMKSKFEAVMESKPITDEDKLTAALVTLRLRQNQLEELRSQLAQERQELNWQIKGVNEKNCELEKTIEELHSRLAALQLEHDTLMDDHDRLKLECKELRELAKEE